MAPLASSLSPTAFRAIRVPPEAEPVTPARILTAFVVSGVVLGALGLYQPLAEFAGAGASVPISGFGNLMANGVKESLRTDGALGILTGALKSSAAGIGAAVFFSLIAGLTAKSKDKN